MPSLSWYYERLSVMSPAEVGLRAYRQGRQWLGRFRRWPTAGCLAAAAVWREPLTAEAFRDGGRVFFSALDTLGPAELASWAGHIEAEADLAAAHRFSYFGGEARDFGEAIDWNRDYASGRDVPVDYVGNLDYHDTALVANVKYVWELNRQQHLVRLGQAYRVTGQERYAQEALAQMTGWIVQCPYLQGINWTSSLEAGIRLISWVWTLELVRPWAGLTDETLGLIAASVQQQLRFIDSHYSGHSSTGNHTIGEASGAYIAATYLPELRLAGRCRERARRLLIKQCMEQNWSDGVNKEQAFQYELFVFDLLLLPALLSERTGEGFGQEYWQRLERMADFVAHVADSRGHLPRVGDEDDGYAVTLAGGGDRRVRAMLNSAAIAFEDSRYKEWAGGVLDERTLWLFGHEGAVKYEALQANVSGAARHGCRHFAQGGYCVFREGTEPDDEVMVVFDCGPLGLEPMCGHGHADALSVVLHLAGRGFLVDAGTFVYQDKQWRRYFKETARHNTLSFVGESQGRYGGEFLWTKKPTVRVLERPGEGAPGGRRVRAEVTWWNGWRHERQIDWAGSKGGVDIVDRWQGQETVEIGFCVAADLHYSLTGDVARVWNADAVLEISSDAAMAWESVWISSGFGRKEESVRLCLRPTEGAERCRTTLKWGFGGQEASGQV